MQCIVHAAFDSARAWSRCYQVDKNFMHDFDLIASLRGILSCVLRDSTPRFVRRSVGGSVGRLVTLYFFITFIS